jgi:ATP-dependent Clp protease adaptor protein ClpS
VNNGKAFFPLHRMIFVRYHFIDTRFNRIYYYERKSFQQKLLRTIPMPHHQQDPDNLPSFLDELDERTDPREPEMYRVILHNDHYTTMDFVVKILVEVFHKPLAEATKIMMNVHRRGKGICGVYTYDIALTKVQQVRSMARQSEFPLKCTLEKE